MHESAPAPGYRLKDRYRLLNTIGAGGMGTVWRATDELLDATVAVKEMNLPPGLTAGARDDRVTRALREARNAARLREHPNVVTVYDAVVDLGAPWIVMELVPSSRSLTDVLGEGAMPAPEVARIGLAVLDALSYGHERGVIHRDVKPSNILLAQDGRALLTDFGIAVHESDSTLTVGGVVGTISYMAPERLAGARASAASDLFSLGVTLYRMLEGYAPFDRETTAATIAAVLHDHPRPGQRSGAFGPVLAGLLAKDPATRPDAGTVATALRQVGPGPTRPLAAFPTPIPAAGAGAGTPPPVHGPGGASGGWGPAVPPVPPRPPGSPGQRTLVGGHTGPGDGSVGYPGRQDGPPHPPGRGGGRSRRGPLIAVAAAVVAVLAVVLIATHPWSGSSGSGSATGPSAGPGASAAASSGSASTAPQGVSASGSPAPASASPSASAVPSASASPGSGVGAGAGGELPLSFRGTWMGHITQGITGYDAKLVFTGGRQGAVVGTSTYSSLSCGGNLTLLSVSGSTVKVRENLTTTGLCIDDVEITLTLTGSSMSYNVAATALSSEGTGTLRRS